MASRRGLAASNRSTSFMVRAMTGILARAWLLRDRSEAPPLLVQFAVRGDRPRMQGDGARGDQAAGVEELCA